MNNLKLSCNSLILDNIATSYKLDISEIEEGREIYLKSFYEEDYKTLIKSKLVDPLLSDLNIENKNITPINIKIISKSDITNNINKCITTNIFTIGRSDKCDIVIDHINVSRIHLFGIVINNNIIIIDTWSLFGTTFYDNKILNNSYLNNRNLLKFKTTDRSIIELSNHLIVFNAEKVKDTKQCIICMELPRIVRYSCGHSLVCINCFNKVKAHTKNKCLICKKKIKQFKISMCKNTYKNPEIDSLFSTTL